MRKIPYRRYLNETDAQFREEETVFEVTFQKNTHFRWIPRLVSLIFDGSAGYRKVYWVEWLKWEVKFCKKSKTQ